MKTSLKIFSEGCFDFYLIFVFILIWFSEGNQEDKDGVIRVLLKREIVEQISVRNYLVIFLIG